MGLCLKWKGLCKHSRELQHAGCRTLAEVRTCTIAVAWWIFCSGSWSPANSGPSAKLQLLYLKILYVCRIWTTYQACFTGFNGNIKKSYCPSPFHTVPFPCNIGLQRIDNIAAITHWIGYHIHIGSYTVHYHIQLGWSIASLLSQIAASRWYRCPPCIPMCGYMDWRGASRKELYWQMYSNCAAPLWYNKHAQKCSYEGMPTHINRYCHCGPVPTWYQSIRYIRTVSISSWDRWQFTPRASISNISWATTYDQILLLCSHSYFLLWGKICILV